MILKIIGGKSALFNKLLGNMDVSQQAENQDLVWEVVLVEKETVIHKSGKEVGLFCKQPPVTQ